MTPVNPQTIVASLVQWFDADYTLPAQSKKSAMSIA
jgi:hypothetical protein